MFDVPKDQIPKFAHRATKSIWVPLCVLLAVFLVHSICVHVLMHDSMEPVSFHLLFAIPLGVSVYLIATGWRVLLKFASLMSTMPQQGKEEGDGGQMAYANSIGFVAHELRNAVNTSVMAWDAALQSDGKTDNPMAARAKSAADHLQNLLNNLLDSSALLEGKLSPKIEKYSLENLVTELLDSFAIACQKKNISLILHYQPGMPEYLELDAFRLKQVLSNLLSNALKFTQQGVLVFSVCAQRAQADQLDLMFSIQDSGPGIDEAELSRLFEAFKQSGTHQVQRFGGSGLGLFICKQWVQLMGGRINLRNRVDRQGAEAQVTIPVRLAQAALSPALHEALNMGPHYLIVVSHSRAEREAIQYNLSMHYPEWTDYSTLADALAHLQGVRLENQGLEQTDSDWFRLDLLIDLDVIKAEQGLIENLCNAMHWFKSRLHVVVLVPYLDQAGHTDYLKQWGLNRLLVKPCFPKAMVNEFFNTRQFDSPTDPRGHRGEQAAGRIELTGFNILLVEDISILLELTRDILLGFGAQVQTASNGAEALACIKNSSRKFDVVLMDVQMPVMNGLEASAEIRKEFSPAELPIVATTSCQFEFEIQRCKDAGMNIHLPKPLNFTKLKEILYGFKPMPMVDDAPACRLYGQELHCLQSGLKNFGGRVSLYSKACTLFITEVGDSLHDLKHSFDDRQKIAAIAHRLVGMSAFVGLNRLASEASRVEMLCMDQEHGSYLTGEVMGLCDLIELSIGVLFDAKVNPSEEPLHFS